MREIIGKIIFRNEFVWNSTERGCTHSHTYTHIAYLNKSRLFFSTKICKGAFVLMKIHLIMLGAGTLPELVGFKRSKKEKKTFWSRVPSTLCNTVAQIFVQVLVKQLFFFAAFWRGRWKSFSKRDTGRKHNSGSTWQSQHLANIYMFTKSLSPTHKNCPTWDRPRHAVV